MNIIGHETFTLHDFGGECELHDLKTIRLSYDPSNFQHLSLIARMFNRAFVNHSGDGDTPGLALVIRALPHIIFTLPELSVSVQFVAAPEGVDPALGCDLSVFVAAAPCGVNVAWQETLMWRLDADGKISERWQTPIPMAV